MHVNEAQVVGMGSRIQPCNTCRETVRPSGSFRKGASLPKSDARDGWTRRRAQLSGSRRKPAARDPFRARHRSGPAPTTQRPEMKLPVVANHWLNRRCLIHLGLVGTPPSEGNTNVNFFARINLFTANAIRDFNASKRWRFVKFLNELIFLELRIFFRNFSNRVSF